MNVNLNHAMADGERIVDEIEASRQIVEGGIIRYGEQQATLGQALLVPDLESGPGVYQVWFPVVLASGQAYFTHVTPDGMMSEIDTINPVVEN